ncbi:MAG: DUF2628 domain-containing protein [Clostridiales bacterium]|nr:DUF2628 domain-containing protein [Clostridiales bacterium]
MSLHMEGQDCPVCHAHLFDDDDAVFCPVCGAPHHRDCYKALGHCALEADHGTPRQYVRPSEASAEKRQQEKEAAGKACPRCGASCASDMLFCPRCGQSFSNPADGQAAYPPPYGPAGGPYQNAGGPPPFGGYGPVRPDPFGGVSPDEEIDGLPAGDIARFVAANTQHYLPRFKRMHPKAKSSWNWAAFFFPGGWLFFRKCYKPGILALLVSFISTVLYMPMQIFMNDITASLPTTISYMEYYDALMLHMGEAGAFAWAAFGLSLLLALCLRIFAGAFGDYIYKKHVLGAIRNIKADESLREDYQGNLLHKGGVNPLMLLVAFMASNWFSALLAMFLL